MTVLLLLFAASFSIVPKQAEAATDPLGINAEAAILVDAETGAVLYEKNADVILGVASMAKMMTEYLVLEAIENGKITWEQEVRINEFVHKLSGAPGLSNVGLTQGENYTVKELYEAMAIHSGNAASVALAEVIAGTEKNFVTLMNKKAEELGLKDYKFVNSTGLNNSSLLGNHPAGNPDEENIMSARATAKLAYHLLKDFPHVLDTASQPSLKFRDGREYKNFNWMLPTLIFEYNGIDGLKTGSTDFAGYGFTATAERNGQRFISVVMKTSSQQERFAETKKIMDYAFSNFGKEEIVPKEFQVKKNESLPVVKGKEDSVEIYTKDPINMVIKNGDIENYKTVLTLDKEKLNKNGELVAPIKKGDKVGTLTVVPKEGESLGFLTEEGHKSIVVDVITADDVEKANWFVLMMRGIGGFFGDLWGSVSSTVKGWF
ncbi:D-alanyl-D-alanine carboxypeptidase family protein [Bacillus dakarensis]|uniref:D-alanyl-D-alanine carboxypeptidase family protein n=1 Tax=Robertmurraya dakarensis TaxID=1926278 RepID=UPI0009819340